MLIILYIDIHIQQYNRIQTATANQENPTADRNTRLQTITSTNEHTTTNSDNNGSSKVNGNANGNANDVPVNGVTDGTHSVSTVLVNVHHLVVLLLMLLLQEFQQV